MAEHYRVDVIFEGALEMAENFTLGDAENEYETQVDDLSENMPNREWVVSIYDEGTEPPTCIKEIHNDPVDN